MAITIQKESYPSVFPHMAIVKIDNIWRICRGHYTDNGGGYNGIFATPHMGTIVKASYPDFRIFDLNDTEEKLYQAVIDLNFSQLSHDISAKKKKIAAAANATVRQETLREQAPDRIQPADSVGRVTFTDTQRADAQRAMEQMLNQIRERATAVRREAQRQVDDFYVTIDPDYFVTYNTNNT